MSFTVRPSNSNSEKEIFRVKLTAASLLGLRVKPGELVVLQLPSETGDGDSGGGDGHGRTPSRSRSGPAVAIAWENSGSGMKDSIVQTSKALQELYGLKLGDRVGIKRFGGTLGDARVITVRMKGATGEDKVVLKDSELGFWVEVLSAVVPVRHDVLAPGQRFVVESTGRKGEFEVVDVGGGLLGRVTGGTQFVFAALGRTAPGLTNAELQLDFTDVGGLRREIEQIKGQISRLLNPRIKQSWLKYRGKHGLLLYGPKGTGKTLLQETLSKGQWGSVITWTPGVRLPTPIYPRLIMADLYDLTGNQKSVWELLAIFKDVIDTPTLIVGEARHPNDISERLRTTNAFSVELETPIPDQDQRLEILRALRGDADQPSDEQLLKLAGRTHGFVGSDLRKLLHIVWELADSRAEETAKQNKIDDHTVNGTEDVNGQGQSYSTEENTPHAPVPAISVEQQDIDASLSHVRPSALQEVFLEKPNVHWTDIGGQHTLKHKLITTVNRTLSPVLRQRMIDFGLEVPKGILLYGPPGCSKTLLAKALATEAELNFLAVKGAELISMYVGESERATREVFRKARAASPSILFFDEIDAIASRPSSGSSRGGGGDLNVLTTLLNEMDGFEELKDVLIVAATNKPQSIDAALLRPGRFDNVVYVGLPDVETRKEIFEKRFRGIFVAEEVRMRIGEWAERTEGYSGAEIVGICKAAAEYALDADRTEIPVEDVEKAILSAPKGITREMLREYEVWNASRSANAS